MMRPVIVKTTAARPPKLPSPADKFAAFEAEVFRTATVFTAVTVRGRDGRERREFSTPAAAFAYAADLPKTAVYAANAKGRSIVLDRALWPSWLERYTEMEKKS